jgi:hypothetical protein
MWIGEPLHAAVHVFYSRSCFDIVRSTVTPAQSKWCLLNVNGRSTAKNDVVGSKSCDRSRARVVFIVFRSAFFEERILDSTPIPVV